MCYSIYLSLKSMEISFVKIVSLGLPILAAVCELSICGYPLNLFPLQSHLAALLLAPLAVIRTFRELIGSDEEASTTSTEPALK